MAAKLEPILTIADLDSMPEDGNRYELIEGELFVSRAPSLTHQGVVVSLLFAFTQYLRENPIGNVWPGPGVIFSDFSGVIPDVIYISNERQKEIATGARVSGAPDLITKYFLRGPRTSGAIGTQNGSYTGSMALRNTGLWIRIEKRFKSIAQASSGYLQRLA